MKNTNEKQKQSSSIHQKIRKASFVSTESKKTETFKYVAIHYLKLQLKKYFLNGKHYLKKHFKNTKEWVKTVDWLKIRTDSTKWLLEAGVEGLTANFATHFLFGITFNPLTVLAHGIFIKQGLDIYKRLKQNGSTTEIPKEDK